MSLRNTNPVSLDYTSKPVFQTAIRHIDGSPHGKVTAPAGTLLANSRDGELWVKQSQTDSATGWAVASLS